MATWASARDAAIAVGVEHVEQLQRLRLALLGGAAGRRRWLPLGALGRMGQRGGAAARR
jgi:hypothetical protein